MATEQSYNGDGSDTTFDITFPYLTHADIGVSVGGQTKTVDSDYSITGNTVTFTTAPPSGTANVKLYRNTNIDTPEHEYSAGSSITAARLNENQRQALYAIEEAKLVTTTSGGITTGNKNDITVNSDTDWVIRANAVEKSMMADNSVGTDEIETNAVTAAELADNAVDTAAIADNAVTQAKINNAVIFTPVGTVIWYAGSTAPAGYLKANGDAIANGSGTTQSITADFSALYAIVGANLPDLRGEFIRGWDDGKGTDSGRSIKSSQGELFKEHTHTPGVSQTTTGDHNHSFKASNRAGDEDGWDGGNKAFAGDDDGSAFTQGADTNKIFDNGSHNHNVGVTIANTGGTETRPRNIALLACIKY